MWEEHHKTVTWEDFLPDDDYRKINKKKRKFLDEGVKRDVRPPEKDKRVHFTEDDEDREDPQPTLPRRPRRLSRPARTEPRVPEVREDDEYVQLFSSSDDDDDEQRQPAQKTLGEVLSNRNGIMELPSLPAKSGEGRDGGRNESSNLSQQACSIQ